MNLRVNTLWCRMKVLWFNETSPRRFNQRHFQTKTQNKSIKISPNLTLHTANQCMKKQQRGVPKTLVLMFPWSQASRSAKQKYCDLYHQRGLDVVSVKCSMKHFLWPSLARTLARELLDYLVTNETPLTTDRLLVHSTSVGAYVYTVTLMEICHNRPRYGFIRSKINGQVFDSIVYGGMPQMLQAAGSLAGDSFMKRSVNNIGAVYLFLTRPFTAEVHEEFVRSMENLPVCSQLLMYHSLNDPLCDSEAFHKLVTRWSDMEDMQVHVKCWENSTHGMHLEDHPEQYCKALEGYLENLGFHDQQQEL